MSIDIDDVDVTIRCEECNGRIDQDEILCVECSRKQTGEALEEYDALLKNLQKYFDMVTLNGSAVIPGDQAVKFKWEIDRLCKWYDAGKR